jgi:hypothetical protein
MSKYGYSNWKVLELNEDEEIEAGYLADTLTNQFNKAFPEAAGTLKITFEKASLTIDEDERRTGAFHGLADGEPFYRLYVEGGSMFTPEAPATQYVFYLVQALGNGGMSLSDPLVTEHDFRDDLQGAATTIGQCATSVIKHIKAKAAPK